jgi:hypothetical protein
MYAIVPQFGRHQKRGDDIMYRLVLFITICSLFLGASQGCERRSGQKEKIFLSRLRAEKGDGSKVRAILTGKTDSQGKNTIAVSNAPCRINVHASGLGAFSLGIIPKAGFFLVNDRLECLDKQFWWDGKYSGAVHILKGKLVYFDYEFNSDPHDPLKFMMQDDGYLRLSGLGTITDLKTRKTYNLTKEWAKKNDNIFSGKIIEIEKDLIVGPGYSSLVKIKLDKYPNTFFIFYRDDAEQFGLVKIEGKLKLSTSGGRWKVQEGKVIFPENYQWQVELTCPIRIKIEGKEGYMVEAMKKVN